MKTKEGYILLDTNVIVALLDKRDSLHKQAVELVEENVHGQFCVLEQIITETYSVIVRRCKERGYDCADAVEKVRELEQRCLLLHVNFTDYHRRIVDALKQNPELNYNDWLLVLFAKDNSFKMLTLDKKVAREAQS